MCEYLDQRYDVTRPELVAILDEAPLWSAAFGRLLLEHVKLQPGVRLLDVGCGTGFPLVELAQRLGPTCQAWGIDPWKPAVARARRKIELLGLRNVHVVEGDAAAMPFEDGRFDLVVSNLGINNFENRAAVLADCHRVAAPGARLALTTNLRGHMQEFYDVFAATLRALGREPLLAGLQAHVDHRATLDETRAVLTESGFTVCEIHEDGFVMRFLDGSALLRHAFIRIGFLDAWTAVVPAEERKDLFAALEDNLNRCARERGCLELTIPMAYVEAEKAVRTTPPSAPGSAGRAA